MRPSKSDEVVDVHHERHDAVGVWVDIEDRWPLFDGLEFQLRQLGEQFVVPEVP